MKKFKEKTDQEKNSRSVIKITNKLFTINQLRQEEGLKPLKSDLANETLTKVKYRNLL